MSETNTTNTNNIISSQSWQSLMHALHNDVRNSRGLKLTGMAALNEINNYLSLNITNFLSLFQQNPDESKSTIVSLSIL